MAHATKTQSVCQICGKRPVSGSNVSHSVRHTKRLFRPNTQKVQGLIVCTRCSRTLSKKILL